MKNIFRKFLFVLKTFVFIGILIFLFFIPGTVTLVWDDYTITIAKGAAACAAFVMLCALLIVMELYVRVTLWPREIMRRMADKKRAKGYDALVASITAAQSGDAKHSYYQAHRAQKLLPANEQALPLLLLAQAGQVRGMSVETHNAYEELAGNNATALLGVKGLVDERLSIADTIGALQKAKEALANHKTKKGGDYTALLLMVYDLECRNACWSDALLTLNRLEKKKDIDKERANTDRQAMYLILGQDALAASRKEEALNSFKKAYGLNAAFAPAAIAYAAQLPTRAALSLLQKTWSLKPQAPITAALLPMLKSGEAYKFFEKLTRNKAGDFEAEMAMAEAALVDGLWGEAKTRLLAAEKLEANERVYKTWVRIEEQTGNRAEVIRQFLDRAEKAEKAQIWVCMRTHRVFENWQGYILPEKLFNTLSYTKPYAARGTALTLHAANAENSVFGKLGSL